MRVASWNLWWRFGPWNERQPAIREHLRRIDADVVLLQEVFGPDDEHDDDQAHDLAIDLGYHWIATTTNEGARTAFGNGVLSRWPILEHDQRRLLRPDATRSYRTALWALLDHPDGPQPVATTHLDWQYDRSRIRQAQLDDLVVWLGTHQPSGARSERDQLDQRPLILGGDFNAVPESDEIRRLVGLSDPYGSEDTPIRVFTDAWAACGEGPGHTWTRANEYSADAQWPRRRLDYLFVGWPRPKPTGNPLEARICGTEPINGVLASDHACVVAEFDDRTLDAPLP